MRFSRARVSINNTMACPKCASEQIEYIPAPRTDHKDGNAEKMHRAHLGHELGNAYKHPGPAAFSLGLSAAVWVADKLSKVLRHPWKCQKCNYTWKGTEDDEKVWLWCKGQEPAIPELKTFTLAAKTALFFAEVNRRSDSATSIEPQHLLNALWRLDEGSSLLLVNNPESFKSFRKDFEAAFPPPAVSKWWDSQPNPPISDELKQVVRFAAEEGRTMTASHIGVGHLVLGLMRVENAPGVVAVLHNRGLELPLLRQRVRGAANPPTP